MNKRVTVYTLVLIMVAGSLFPLTRASFSIDTYNDWMVKRSIQRRSFLKSFCARRCNIGQGGNVCKCNGFHFAGKRSDGDSNVLLNDDQTADGVSAPNRDVLYKMFEDNDKIRVQDSEEEDLVQRNYKPTFGDRYPAYLQQVKQENRFDPVLDLLLRTYMYNEDE